MVGYGGIGDQGGSLRWNCLYGLEMGNYRRTRGSYVSHNSILPNTMFAFHTMNLMHNIRRFAVLPSSGMGVLLLFRYYYPIRKGNSAADYHLGHQYRRSLPPSVRGRRTLLRRTLRQPLVQIDFAFVLKLQGSVYNIIFKLYDSMAEVIKSYHFKDCS